MSVVDSLMAILWRNKRQVERLQAEIEQLKALNHTPDLLEFT